MHPTLIKLGNFELRWYGVMVAAGFLVGLWTAARRARREKIAPEVIWNLGTWIIVGSLLGAKLFYVVAHWNEFLAAPAAMLRSGFVFYGGLCGAVVVTIFLTMGKHLSLWKLADLLAPSLALGHAFGRVGCFLNGCCYGRACDMPWAVRYSWEHETHHQPVHPTQLYEAAGLLAIAAVLSWFYSRKKFDGQVWWLYALSYAWLRFVVEFFRGDIQKFLVGGIWFSFAQFLSIVLGAVAIGFLIKLHFRSTP